MNSKPFNLLGEHPRHWEDFLLNDSGLASGIAEMRAWLVHSGDFRFMDNDEHDIYPFATPIPLPRSRYSEIVQWTERIVRALEETGKWLLRHPHVRERYLSPGSPAEKALFDIDPGFEEMAPIHRLDFILPVEGPPQLLEINCGCPGGELDPALVAGAFLSSSLAQKATEGVELESGSQAPLEYRDPRDDSLENLLRCYRAFRASHPDFPESPTIALITSSAQAHFMIPECRGIAAHYGGRGYEAMVGDLLELESGREGLRLRGERIHLVFRKFSTLSFLRRMDRVDVFGEEICSRVRRIREAIETGRVCMVNPLGSTALQDKGILQLLRARYPELREVIPETRILGSDLPQKDPDIWDEILQGQSFILKRRISFGGRHVVLEPLGVRERAPSLLKESPGQWVVQRRVRPAPHPFAVWLNDTLKVGRFPFDISPFGRGFFVRVGLGGEYEPLNAHARGATSCALVF